MIGADRAGIVGVAWGMTIGYAAVAWLTGAAACVPALGWRPWWGHLARPGRTLPWFGLGAAIAAHAPLGPLGRWPDFAARCLILAAWLLPTLWVWGRRQGWGGLGKWRRPTGSLL